MITVSSFFSGSMNTVDAVIGNFVSQAYTHFIQANMSLITLLFTFYIMFMGYRFLTHRVLDMGEIIKHLIVILCVYALVMNWKLYHLFIYNIFTNEPANIAKILIDSASFRTGTDIAKALDKIYELIINATVGFFGQVSFSLAGIAFIFYALLVFIIGTLMCVFALLLFIYSKMMMAVALALGPIFILFILWEPTKNLFGAWLGKLISLALIPVVTSAILVLMLSVINVTLPHLNQPTEHMQFVGVAPFLGLSLATTLILSQVLSVCSALGGGITLTSLSAGAAIASSAFEKTGISSMGRNVAQRLRHTSTHTSHFHRYGG
jgi:type IV secretion system protein VirB6